MLAIFAEFRVDTHASDHAAAKLDIYLLEVSHAQRKILVLRNEVNLRSGPGVCPSVSDQRV